MDWSTRKKLGCFGMIGLVILLIAAYYVYKIFFTHVPTCFDGIQNQDEQGIDCGGVCANFCSWQEKSIVPLWARAFPIQNGVYSLVAYVQNQNINAGIEQINYEFRVYDSNNILAGDPVTGTTFIEPNQSTAIFQSPVSTGNRIPKNVFFSFTSTPVWTKTDPKYSVPQLTTANTHLTNTDTAPKLSADVINNTLFNYNNIEVVAILYGADGNAINASDTYIASLPQQSKQTVYFTWPQKFSEPVTNITIIPRLDPFTQSQ